MLTSSMGLHRSPRFSTRLSLSLVAVGGLILLSVACSGTDGSAEVTPNPDGKPQGAECEVPFDCRSGVCTDGKCAPSAAALSGSPSDGAKNGDETDVDCGGSRAPKCADGKSCEGGADCTSAKCTGGKCVAPSPTDTAKNGTETDVDCGGATAPKCALGKACAAHSDCASDACSYEKKCVELKGCTGHFGGDTCGEGETGAPDAKHESCCTTVNIPTGPQGAFKIDKYQVTAGRMRAFVERYQGNLKQWASTNPKGWDASLTSRLPENMDDVNILLGPNSKEGCNVANQGGRTFWQPAIGGNAAEVSDFSQDVLDEKALNCVTWLMAAAVCAFDGGHLVSAAEMAWVFENRGRQAGSTSYPWGFADTTAYTKTVQDERLVHRYSYLTPNPPATMRVVGTGTSAYPLDHAFFVAPPGRRPKGANMEGVQDAAGNVMPWVRDKDNYFTWTASWEKHDKNLKATDYATVNDTPGANGYYAIGARCSY